MGMNSALVAADTMSSPNRRRGGGGKRYVEGTILTLRREWVEMLIDFEERSPWSRRELGVRLAASVGKEKPYTAAQISRFLNVKDLRKSAALTRAFSAVFDLPSPVWIAGRPEDLEWADVGILLRTREEALYRSQLELLRTAAKTALNSDKTIRPK